MRKLLQSILFIIVAFFAVDRLGGQIMWWVNQHTEDLLAPKLRYLAYEINEEVVLLGTSRCNCHYVPSILKDSINLSVYNGGVDASNCIFSHYFVLSHILSHHTPKLICLELMTNDYVVADDSFEPTSFFAPYIGKNERGDSIFREAGNYWIYHFCHLYRYNAKAVSNIGGLLVNRQHNSELGYVALPQPIFSPDRPGVEHTSHNVDVLKLQYLKRFISLCQSNNVALVFMVSPAYTKADTDLYDVLKDIAEDNQIPFFDYHTKGVFLDHPEYFKDDRHLWDKGARLYTSIFAHDLKDYIKCLYDKK